MKADPNITKAKATLAGVFSLCWLMTLDAIAGPELTVGNVTGQIGSTVSVPVSFQSDSNVVALSFDLVFDAARLSSGAAVGGNALAGHLVDSAETISGTRRVVIYSLANAPLKNGTLINIPMTISEIGGLGVTTISVTNATFANLSASSVAPTRLTAGTLTIAPVSVRLGAIAFSNNGVVQFELSGVQGRQYVVQASTNLVDWTNLQTNVANTATALFTDPAVANFKQRFYRALLP